MLGSGEVRAQEQVDDSEAIPYEVLKREAAQATTVGKQAAPMGSGELEDGKFDISISVRFDATDEQLNELRDQFQRASELLYDATDGQHQFGKIHVCNNSRGGKNADIWILENDGRSYVPGGCVPGLGSDGCRVMLYYDSALEPSNGVADGAHTIVHEWGHYAYGIYDEYVQNDGSTSAICVAPDEDGDFPHDGSLMENYWLREITEFCVASTHDGDNPNTAADESDDTRQESQRGESSWETIERFFPDVTVPADLPDEGPTENADDIEWEVLEPETRLMLVIDRSGSMSFGDRIENAREGAKLFADLTEDGDKLGVASFSSDTRVDFSLTEVGAGAKAGAKTAIDAINAGGLTNIGGGLRSGLAEITGAGDPACQQTIILLSDGAHNTGINPLTVIPDLKRNGVVVHAIALGAGGNTPLLRDVAEQTGGQLFFADSAGDLAGIFAALQTETSENGGLITSALQPMATGDVAQQEVSIDEDTETATFLLSWAGPADIDLTLTTPSGASIVPSSANGTIEFVSSGRSAFYRIETPEAGLWTMEFEVSSAAGTVDVTAQASSVHEGINLSASPDKISYEYPERVHIMASPQAPVNVTGATVTGRVRRPDGTTESITLHDDGEHDDGVADDGVYGAFFNRYTEDGGYSFEITASTHDGGSGSGAFLFSGEGIDAYPELGFIPPSGPSDTPAPAFVRTENFSVNVSGVRANQPPTADAGEDQTVECESHSGSAVTLDGSGSSDPDGDDLTFIWREDGTIIAGPTSEPTAEVELDLGTHSIELTVDDGRGGTDTDEVEITIEDTTPPDITVESEPIVLWPANHTYQTINLSEIILEVTDACDAEVSIDDVVLTSVSSDEAENARGRGDGNTTDDIVLSNQFQTVDLRAERSARGNGRVYTFHLGAADASGNVGTTSFQVHVPVNQGKNSEVEDDGPVYVVEGYDFGGAASAKTLPATQVEKPAQYKLSQNYPNPFNPSTRISFQIAEPGNVTLRIFDLLGREVVTLVNQEMSPGTYDVQWNGRSREGVPVTGGVYIYRLQAGSYSESNTMLLLK